MKPITQDKAEREARSLLDQAGVKEPPVSVDEIATMFKVDVQRRPNGPDVSGLLYRDGGLVVIGINQDDSPARQRFTLAHELGHLRLHKGRPLWVDRTARLNLRGVGDEGRGGEEREANWFAAELLMPEAMVRAQASEVARRQLSGDGMVQALAEIFDVSRVAMGYRLFNLGLVRNL